MTELRQATNQELLRELRNRIKTKKIDFSFPWQKGKDWEKKLAQAYEEWANDPEEWTNEDEAWADE